MDEHEKKFLKVLDVLETKGIIKRNDGDEPPFFSVVEGRKEEFDTVMFALFDV